MPPTCTAIVFCLLFSLISQSCCVPKAGLELTILLNEPSIIAGEHYHAWAFCLPCLHLTFETGSSYLVINVLEVIKYTRLATDLYNCVAFYLLSAGITAAHHPLPTVSCLLHQIFPTKFYPLFFLIGIQLRLLSFTCNGPCDIVIDNHLSQLKVLKSLLLMANPRVSLCLPMCLGALGEDTEF